METLRCGEAPACPYCGVRGLPERRYQQHLLSAHSEEFFHCAECDTYVDRKSLVLHMSLHALHYATSDAGADTPAIDSANKITDNVDESTANARRGVEETQKTDLTALNKDLNPTRINVVINAQSNILVDSIVNENHSKKVDMQQNLLVIKRVIPTHLNRTSVERTAVEHNDPEVTANPATHKPTDQISGQMCLYSENVTEAKNLFPHFRPAVPDEPKIISQSNCLNVDTPVTEQLQPNNRISMEPPVEAIRVAPEAKHFNGVVPLQYSPDVGRVKAEMPSQVELRLEFEQVLNEPKHQDSRQAETEQNCLNIERVMAEPVPSEVEQVVAELSCPDHQRDMAPERIIVNDSSINELAVTDQNLGQVVTEPELSCNNGVMIGHKPTKLLDMKDTFLNNRLIVKRQLDIERIVAELKPSEDKPGECLSAQRFVADPIQRDVGPALPEPNEPFFGRGGTQFFDQNADLIASESKRQDVTRIVEQIVAERNRIADFGRVFSKQNRNDIERGEFSDHSDADSFDPLPESIFDAIDDSQDSQTDVPKPENASMVGHTGREEMVTGKKKKNQAPRICPICQKEYRASSSYFYHMKYFHRGAREHECTVCGKRFGTRAVLAQHRALHAPRAPLSCDTCGKAFRSKVSLYIHAQNHNSADRFLCDCCPLSFRWKQQLLRHLKRHAAEKGHACPVCGKAFKVRCDMMRHSRTHAAGAHACQHCGACFAQRRYLKAHVDKKHANQQVNN